MPRSALLDVITLRGAVDITTTGAEGSCQLEEIKEDHTLQVSWSVTSTRAISALSVDLEGSLDGSSWFQLGQIAASGTEITNKAAIEHYTGKPVAYVRANVTAITLTGTGTALLKLLYTGV